MIGIGIRVVSNSQVFYSLIEKQEDDTLSYLDTGFVNVPHAIEWPEALRYIRNTVLDILNEYEVERAAIRIAEFGRTNNKVLTQRSYIEGVLQESLASSNVQKFLAGQISTLTSVAKIGRTAFKKYADGLERFPYYPTDGDWSKLTLEARESILTCYAALNL